MKNQLLFILLLLSDVTAVAQIPSNGLVAYYPFTGNANDASGFGNNGTVFGATLTADRFGNANSAYFFNGTSAYISLPVNTGMLSGDTQFSITYWLNEAQLNNTAQTVFSYWLYTSAPQGTPLGFYTSIADGVPYSSYVSGLGVGDSSSVNASSWYNVVITYDGTQPVQSNRVKLYLNGSLTKLNFSCLDCSSNIPSSLATTADTTSIGARLTVSGFTDFFNGALDDIAIYDRVLTQQEVTQIYNNNSSCLFYDTIQVFDTITVHNTVYDTSHVTVFDTTIVTIYDTTHNVISTTDTLIIQANLTGIAPPNNTNTLKVYPNPAHNYLEIDCGNYASMSGYTIKIVNSIAQTVFLSTITQQLYSVNLDTLSGTGTYLLYILDPNQTIVATKEVVIL